MLLPQELKVVLATLTQRRAWLLKSLDAKDVSPTQREESVATLKTLDSAMQKLARMPPSKNNTGPAVKPAPSAPKKLSKKKIDPADAYALIAEDDAASIQLLKGVLEDIGIQKIDVVENGRAALYALQNCSPAFDIVLCDWEMPEMNGLEVRRQVKSLAKLQDTYYMMVTGMTEVAKIREAIALGVNDYIAKPVDVDTLEKKVRTFLQGDEDTSATGTQGD